MPSITDADLEGFLKKEQKAEKAARDADRVAKVFVSFYSTLRDDGHLDEFTCQQLTLVYARRILNQRG